jgi:tetratricopeptide (TPR) repeat protein
MAAQQIYDPELLLAIAGMDFQAGRLADALRGYQTVLRLRPEDSKALYHAGATEVQLGRVAEGLRRMERAIALDPLRLEFQIGLANIYGRLGRFDDAIKAAGRTVRQAPESVEAFGNLIRIVFESAMRGEQFGQPTLSSVGEKSKSISVISCSRSDQEGRRIKEHYQAMLRGHDFEIVQIYDARSLCEGYNRGFAQARGDVLVFSHDDIEILSADFADRLLRHLSANDIVGIAGTSRLVGPSWTAAGWPRTHGCIVHDHLDGSGFDFECYGPPSSGPIEALDGVFIAANRKVCETVRFDEATFDGFHFYDLDFCYRAFLQGFRIAVPWDILIAHRVRPDHPVNWGKYPAEWEKYVPVFMAKHGGRLDATAGRSNKRWPAVHFASKAQVIAFHQAMALAQSAC